MPLRVQFKGLEGVTDCGKFRCLGCKWVQFGAFFGGGVPGKGPVFGEGSFETTPTISNITPKIHSWLSVLFLWQTAAKVPVLKIFDDKTTTPTTKK